MEINKYIGIYDNLLPWPIVSNLLKYCNYINYEKAKVLDTKGKDINDDSIRKVKGKFLFNFGVGLTEIHWSNYLFSKFNSAIQNYIEDKNLILARYVQIRDIQVLKYENTNFYNWHIDHAATVPRTISLVYFLNNDYEGGELCFKDGDGSNEVAIEKKPNRVIIWPSTFLYPHTVKPVTKGTRYSVVCWAL